MIYNRYNNSKFETIFRKYKNCRYGFLEDAVNESGVDVNRKIQETEFLLDRLSGSEKWKQMVNELKMS